MKKKSSPNPTALLESRLAKAEFNIARISETVYDLIQRLQQIPDPPCPPMCGFASDGRTAKKSSSKKSRK